MARSNNHGGARKGAGRKAKHPHFNIAESCDDVLGRRRNKLIRQQYLNVWRQQVKAIESGAISPDDLNKQFNSDIKKLADRLNSALAAVVVPRNLVLRDVARHYRISASTVDRCWKRWRY